MLTKRFLDNHQIISLNPIAFWSFRVTSQVHTTGQNDEAVSSFDLRASFEGDLEMTVNV